MNDWRAHAACAEVDGELFHPPQGGGATACTSLARTICAGCRVRVECLAAALEYDASDQWGGHGVWGGLTPAERRRLRKASGGP